MGKMKMRVSFMAMERHVDLDVIFCMVVRCFGNKDRDAWAMKK